MKKFFCLAGISFPILLFYSFVIFGGAFLIIVISTSGITQSIVLCVFGPFISILFVLALISFIDGCVPIYINYYGLIKNGELHRWEDAKEMKLIGKVPTRYGYAYIRIVISYNDGKEISFEPNKFSLREIKKYCEDIKFINMFSKTMDNE